MVDKTKIKDYVYTERRHATVMTPLAGSHRTVIYRSRRPGSKHGHLVLVRAGAGLSCR